MAKKQAELIENGKINLKVKATRLLDYLKISDFSPNGFNHNLEDWHYTVRQLCGSSEEELVKHFNADDKILNALRNGLPSVGLRLGMKKLDFDIYISSGKIQSPASQETVREPIKVQSQQLNSTVVSSPPRFFPSAAKPTVSVNTSTPNPKEEPDISGKPKHQTKQVAAKSKNKEKKVSSTGATKYVKPYGDTERTRRNMMFFRASDEEKASLEAAADKCGMKPSAYIRSQVLGKTPREAFTPEERQLFMDNLEILSNVRQMRNYFNNNRKDPNVWKQLVLVVDYMSKKIQELKK